MAAKPGRPDTSNESTVPNAKSALATSRKYATHPHLAGAPEDFEDAKSILAAYQSHFGIPAPSTEPIFSAGTPDSRAATLNITALTEPSAWIDVYYPVLNTALDHSLQILGEDGEPLWSADLEEDGDVEDPEAGKYRNAVSTWHGLSSDGDVQGQLVYVNYGTKEDYDSLVEKGVNFTDKVVLARYGGVFRGLKVRFCSIKKPSH
jgi:N-acetylated-alpha-linked acidic dipeptidase